MEKIENIYVYMDILSAIQNESLLETVQFQENAKPYHDWNERITAECYAANSSSHILDSNNKIKDISNNYSKISFNFGPPCFPGLKAHIPVF